MFEYSSGSSWNFADRIFYTADAVDMKEPLLDDFLDEDLEDTSDSEQDKLTILILELYSFESRIDCSTNKRTNTPSSTPHYDFSPPSLKLS